MNAPPAADPRQDRKEEEEAPPAAGALARLRAYFLAGVLVTAPIGFTSYLAWLFLVFVDDKIKPLIPAVYNPETYLPFSIPGLGLIALLAGLTMIGMLTAGFLGRALVRIGERIVARMPVVRGIYSASKQVIETVVGRNATSFREVVLVEFPRRDCWAIGFITGVAKGEIQRLTKDEMVNVFVPTTPNPTSGYLVFVPRGDTVPLTMSVEDGIKLVVSGGIVMPPEPGAAPKGGNGRPRVPVAGNGG